MIFQGYDSSLGLDNPSKFKHLLIPEKCLLLWIIRQAIEDYHKAQFLLKSPEYVPTTDDYQLYKSQKDVLDNGIYARNWIHSLYGFNAPVYSFEWCCDMTFMDLEYDPERAKENIREITIKLINVPYHPKPKFVHKKKIYNLDDYDY